MVLPKLKRCCGCLSLETGCCILGVLSLLACILAISFCSVKFPHHRHQQNEDNLILLSMTMFSSLSAISNIAVLAGIAMKRPSFLQLALLSNSVFILCILLVSSVTLLFSPGLRDILQMSGHLVLAAFIILIVISAGYAFYYLSVINSLYAKMKMTYGDSAIPV